MDDISVGLAKAQSETAETCATCGRPLTQRGPNGECLRCLVSLTFLGDDEQPERPAARGRLTPGPLRYAHFEVETGADGFPIELGAGAMAITYRARDTVLSSLVALKVIDRKVAQNPGPLQSVEDRRPPGKWRRQYRLLDQSGYFGQVDAQS